MTDETQLPDPTGASGSSKKMSDHDYAQAKELYELGRMRLAELAEKYGVSRQAISKRFKADDVSYGSRAAEVSAAASAGVKTAVASQVGQQVAAALERYADKRLDWIEETRLNGYKALKQADILAKKIVADAVKNSAALATVDDDLKAVQRFQKILVENTLTRLDVLKANEVVDEDDLPNIHFEDLTDEDILEHHKSNGLIDDDADPDEILAELNDVEIPA